MECTPAARAAFGRTVVVRTRRGQHTSQAGGAMTVRESGESRGNVLDSVTIAAELEALGALIVDRPYPGLTRHHHLGGQASKIVFVFPGQGAQYPGMGAQLYRHHRGFARLVDECDQALAPWTGWSVRDVLCQEPEIGRASCRERV